MNPFDYTKAFTDFWTAQGQALMKTQEQAGKAMAEGMQAMASGVLPALPSIPADLSANVTELSRAGQSQWLFAPWGRLVPGEARPVGSIRSEP